MISQAILTAIMMIFFDIDETLLDQRQAEAAAVAELLHLFGDELPRHWKLEDMCRRWRDLREQHSCGFLRGEITFHEQRRRRIRELFNGRAVLLDDSEIDRRVQVYAERYRSSWILCDDVLPCLERLRGNTLGVISNGSTTQQRDKLTRTGLAHYFSSVFVSEEIGAAKPEPRIFAEVCRLAGYEPQECVYVGDRLQSDAISSSLAGMRGIWINRRRKVASAPVEVIHSLEELPGLLRRPLDRKSVSLPLEARRGIRTRSA